MRKTALYDSHVSQGAKIVPFAGWEMPLFYRGVVHEHLAVRNKVGLFDVSHMGVITIEGEGAEPFLDYISTNKIAGKKEGTVVYTPLCHDHGGTVDDVLCYRVSPTLFFIVANGSNRQKDWEHLAHYASSLKVTVTPPDDNKGILALQGPRASQVISSLFPEASQLEPMHFLKMAYQHQELIVSATGYTGSGGYEIYCPLAVIHSLWDELLENGINEGIEPVGLGARDTLRLEMGYALYGHELNDAIAPLESVAAWAVKMDKPTFLGKEALEKLAISNNKRFQRGVILKEKGVPREGCEVYQNGELIGTVTSGTFSPLLDQGIAIAMSEIPLKKGDAVNIKIRHRYVPAEVIQLPFLKV